MSSETITTALFLITAVIAAGVLINAVYPVVYTMAGTFSTQTHETDTRMRTDFKVIASFSKAGNPGSGEVYLKNIGSQRIGAEEIPSWDVFFGKVGQFSRVPYETQTASGPYWVEDFDGDASYDLNGNHFWDPGETVKITVSDLDYGLVKDDPVYFQVSLPNGIWRSVEFTVS